MSISRAMMIHSSIHWPDLSDTSLWPMAVQHAVHIWNHVPNPETGLCPSDLFTRTRYSCIWLPCLCSRQVHCWWKEDSPLEPKISTLHVFCQIKSHASNVPLVFNPATGSITPQLHVVLDDWFATVNTTVDDLPDFNSPDWTNLFGESEFQYILDDEDMSALRELSEDLENSVDSSNAEFARNRVLEAVEQLGPASTLDPPLFTVRPKPEPKLEPTLDYPYGLSLLFQLLCLSQNTNRLLVGGKMLMSVLMYQYQFWCTQNSLEEICTVASKYPCFSPTDTSSNPNSCYHSSDTWS